MRNPPAFDQILIDNYESLERTVDPRWLPLPVLVASKAAQHIRMRREHLIQSEAWAAHLRKEGNEAEAKDYLERTKRHSEEEIAKMLKQRQWRQGFTEYGSGHYGTIYPTQIKGIVCKITTDHSEAQFVANAMSLGKFPPGIVKYYQVVSLNKRYKNRPVYALWREEVQPPTLSAEKEDSNKVRFIGLLHASKAIGAQIRLTIQRRTTSGYKLGEMYKRIAVAVEMSDHGDVPEYLQADFSHLERWETTVRWINGLNYKKPRLEAKLGALLYAFRSCCENMHLSYGFLPGSALDFYQEHGMILADVHANNVMKEIDGEGDWLISDPGHMVELSNRYAHVQIPQI